MLDKFSVTIPNIEDLDIVFFHITTSKESCESIKKHGILDLCNSYRCFDSELRKFLNKNEIFIDIEKAYILYKNRKYSIFYDKRNCPQMNTREYYLWSIGRKFFYDFTVCGFLSIWDSSPYGGYIHKAPEILIDIDNLLKTNLWYEWAEETNPFEVVVKVSGRNIVADAQGSEREIMIAYLVKALDCAFSSPSEEVLLMKDNIEVKPNEIMEINAFTKWK